MNSDYENSNMNATSLEALIQANGQAVEIRQRIPYEMVVYAIPEQWREEEMELLRQAVKFQPTLYTQIDTLATRQDLQYLLTDQRTVLQAESREMQNSMRRVLEQDGSAREKFSSELSGMLSDSLKAMEATTVRLEQKVKKLTRISVAASMAASVLVCVVWHLLAG